MAAAEELKYVSAIKAEVAKEFTTPSPDLVRMLAKRVYDGSFTAKVATVFEGLTNTALRQYLTDQVNARLKSALGETSRLTTEAPPEPDTPAPANPIETTEEETEAFMIVRAIVASEVPVERVTPRDRQTYFGVLLDDNNRKPICRFHFNSKTVKYLSLIHI